MDLDAKQIEAVELDKPFNHVADEASDDEEYKDPGDLVELDKPFNHVEDEASDDEDYEELENYPEETEQDRDTLEEAFGELEDPGTMKKRKPSFGKDFR